VVVSHSFPVVNTCGCLTAVASTEPIRPNGAGEVTAEGGTAEELSFVVSAESIDDFK
jgi:hypothetical protein